MDLNIRIRARINGGAPSYEVSADHSDAAPVQNIDAALKYAKTLLEAYEKCAAIMHDAHLDVSDITQSKK